MLPIGAIDKGVATMVWMAKYSDVYRKTSNERIAIEAADQIVRKTQSRGGPLFSSSIYRGSGFTRALTMFTSDLNQSINHMYEMVGSWKHGDTPEKIYEAFMFFIVSALVSYLARTAFSALIGKGKPEDFVKELASSFTGSIPVIGDLMVAPILWGLDEIAEARGVKPDKSWRMYIGDVTPGPLAPIANATQAMANGKFLDAAIKGFAPLSGLPIDAPIRAFKGGKNAIEYGDLRYLFWTRSALKNQSVEYSMAKRYFSTRPDDRKALREWLRDASESEVARYREEVQELRKEKIEKAKEKARKLRE
jgi:hypothetical protein